MTQGASLGVYTVGYEGSAIAPFVERLTDEDIEVLVDIREMPVSRKPGFSKTRLSEQVQDAGIEYLHFRSLGSPRAARQRLREDGDFGAFAAQYQIHLNDNPENLRHLVEVIMSGKRVALMCFERDHSRCHRSLLASELEAELDGDVRVYHI